MIKAIFRKENNKYKNFEISGHANSIKGNEYYDMVCAGVSSIVFGILNSFEDRSNINIEIKENFIKIDILDLTSEINIIFKVLEKSLKTILESNEKYIKIVERNENDI